MFLFFYIFNNILTYNKNMIVKEYISIGYLFNNDLKSVHYKNNNSFSKYIVKTNYIYNIV